MKKLSILFACVAMSLSLGVAGCKKKEEKKDTPAAATDNKPADPAGKPADPAAKPAEGDKPATAPAPAASGDLPAACAEYKSLVEKLASCDKMPQQSRDALKQGYDAMSAGWANVASMPAETKASMDEGCKKGVEALKTAAAQICGW